MSNYEKEIEVRGHLVDSSILTRIFDKVMDMKGDFTVEEFAIGKKKEDHSYAKLVIRGNSESHLSNILENLFREGATSVSVDSVTCVEAPKDMVLPDDFYSTTNNATQIYFDNTWITVERMMMDKCIVLDPVTKTAECKTNREIRKGDLIVTGEKGIKIVPQERPREGVDIFQFMSSTSSSERPTQQIAKKSCFGYSKNKAKFRKDYCGCWTSSGALRRIRDYS